MRFTLALIISVFSSIAIAQTTQPQSSEQLYRQINSVLAQDNARLGDEKEQFQQRLNSIFAELAKAQARIKELEAKQGEKK